MRVRVRVRMRLGVRGRVHLVHGDVEHVEEECGVDIQGILNLRGRVG